MVNDLSSLLQTYDTNDRALIERAYRRAQSVHTGQLRASGDPYISHPVAVAQFLADLGFDATSVAAALMHDVLEDSPTTRQELELEFGNDVAFLVDGVTKLASIKYRGTAKDKKSADLQTESLKKMFFAMAQDIRVIVIKLADRLHNMRTLGFKNPESRTSKAIETIEIYAPIAARLGMGRLKGELEDLAFPYAYPLEYGQLKKTIKGKYTDRLRYIERTAPVVKRHLLDAQVTVLDMHSRAKRLWSLYQKLRRYGTLDTDSIMDLVALRIIVPDVKSCYEALGVIHAHYRPVPGRIKDYIALPKPNGYQSLHTTVFCEKGRIAEIQIRTQAMHDHAENGIAAHWAYSEQGKRQNTVAKQQELAWINQLKSFLKGIKNSSGMADLKIDFFKNRIFALTPQGDVKDLPEGATPLDFAYAVHSELGHRTTGALVNGAMVALTHTLQSGDVVELLKAKEAKPSRDWLRIVKTNQAAKHIRAWFNRITTSAIAENEILPTPKILPRKKQLGHKPTSANLASIVIDGQSGMAYKLGKCCSPTTAHQVVGYLTLTRGVTVHQSACANIKTADPARLLRADWNS